MKSNATKIVRVTVTIYEILRKVAFKRRTTQGEVIAEAVRQYLEMEKKQKAS